MYIPVIYPDMSISKNIVIYLDKVANTNYAYDNLQIFYYVANSKNGDTER